MQHLVRQSILLLIINVLNPISSLCKREDSSHHPLHGRDAVFQPDTFDIECTVFLSVRASFPLFVIPFMCQNREKVAESVVES